MAPMEILSALTSETINICPEASRTRGNQRIGRLPREGERRSAPVLMDTSRCPRSCRLPVGARWVVEIVTGRGHGRVDGRVCICDDTGHAGRTQQVAHLADL